MAGTGYHPEGHKTKAYGAADNRLCANRKPHIHVICENCAEVCPQPGSECIDDC